jgi:uncharacterized phage protein (TIGR01671 family)
MGREEMSREIKFRAWDGKKMLHNVGIHPFIIQALWRDKDNKMKESDDGAYIVSPAFTAYHIMQFTGLHDKNGKEIYEGDILRLLDSYNNNWSRNGGEVIFSNKYVGGWVITSKGHDLTIGVRQHEVEIIGNIYETPELLNA